MAYESKFFAQGDSALAFLDLLDAQGPQALLDYLDSAGALDTQGEMREHSACGASDSVEQVGRFVISHNARLSYVGVELFHFERAI